MKAKLKLYKSVTTSKEIKFVFGRRTQLLIFLRKTKFKTSHYLIRIYRKLFTVEIKKTKTILILPKITKVEVLQDYLNKISWAIKTDDNNNIKIYFFVSKNLEIDDLKFFKRHKYQRNYIDITKVVFIKNRTEYKIAIRESEIILLWKSKYLFRLILTRHLAKVMIVDKKFYSSYESTVWYRLKFDLLSKKEIIKLKFLSKQNYIKLLEKNKNKNQSFIFVTGPSFNSYKEFNYGQNPFKVICNTIVKNHEFLEYIGGPDLITFADPAFHFSSCEYAAKFRDEVVQVVEKYDSFILIPLFTVPLILQHYPNLKERIIGIEVNNKHGINFPYIDKFWVSSSPSILSYMMLPVASVLTDEINIIGADGREKHDNYFWKHNKSVQYDNLMESVFQTHPSFFRDRFYDKHYDKHVKYLSNLLIHGEKLGKKYYTLTPSHVPALQERYKVNK